MERTERPQSTQRDFQGTTYRAGEVLWRTGEPSDYVCLIVSGTVAQYRVNESGEETFVADVEANNLVGESALYSSQPRIGTARAVDDVVLVVTDGEHLRRRIARFDTVSAINIQSLLAKIKFLVSMLDDQQDNQAPPPEEDDKPEEARISPPRPLHPHVGPTKVQTASERTFTVPNKEPEVHETGRKVGPGTKVLVGIVLVLLGAVFLIYIGEINIPKAVDKAAPVRQSVPTTQPTPTVQPAQFTPFNTMMVVMKAEKIRSSPSKRGVTVGNAHCCAPPAQIRTWSLNHPAPTSGA